MKPFPVRRIIHVTLCVAVIAGAYWIIQRSFMGNGSENASADDDSNAAAASGDATGGVNRKQVEAISRKAQTMVEDYAEVRRKLQSGELTALPPELAPPPVPQPAEPTPTP